MEAKFKCPRCGSTITYAMDPESWVELTYDEDGNVVDCESHSGMSLMNECCIKCEAPVDPSWGEKA